MEEDQRQLKQKPLPMSSLRSPKSQRLTKELAIVIASYRLPFRILSPAPPRLRVARIEWDPEVAPFLQTPYEDVRFGLFCYEV